MTNSVDPDQLASSETNWSGYTLFTKAWYIQDQEVQGYFIENWTWKVTVYLN